MAENEKVQAEFGRMENREMVGDPFGLQRGAKEATTELVELKHTVESLQTRMEGHAKRIAVLETIEGENIDAEAADQDFTEYQGMEHQAKMEFAIGMAEEMWEKLEAFCDEHEMRMVLNNLQQRLIDYHLRERARAQADGKTPDASK